MNRIAASILAAALLPSSTAAPALEQVQQEPRSLAEFALLQYVAAGSYPPAVVMALDNNSRILLACREGRSTADLRQSGIEFADSQIELLIAMNLLVRDKFGVLYTTFPILNEPEVLALRNEISELAEGLLEVVRDDVETLADELEGSGWSDHGYSLVFSYALDGMVWGFFEEYRQVPPRRLTARAPFWSGEIWAMRPARADAPGTRSVAQGDLTLKVTSRTSAAADPNGLFSDSRLLKQALGEYRGAGRVEDERVRGKLAEHGLVDADGRWLIPVIDEVAKGPVFRAAETLTSDLVDAILDRIDLEGLQKRYGFRSPQQALVVSYHELMWSLMERFVEAGLIRPPEALTRASNPERGAFAARAFLVDRRSRIPDRRDATEPEQDPLEPSEPRGAGG